MVDSIDLIDLNQKFIKHDDFNAGFQIASYYVKQKDNINAKKYFMAILESSKDIELQKKTLEQLNLLIKLEIPLYEGLTEEEILEGKAHSIGIELSNKNFFDALKMFELDIKFNEDKYDSYYYLCEIYFYKTDKYKLAIEAGLKSNNIFAKYIISLYYLFLKDYNNQLKYLEMIVGIIDCANLDIMFLYSRPEFKDDTKVILYSKYKFTHKFLSKFNPKMKKNILKSIKGRLKYLVDINATVKDINEFTELYKDY